MSPRKKQLPPKPVQTYTHSTYVREYARFNPGANAVSSEMVEDELGQWVELQAWEKVWERKTKLEKALEEAVRALDRFVPATETEEYKQLLKEQE